MNLYKISGDMKILYACAGFLTLSFATPVSVFAFENSEKVPEPANSAADRPGAQAPTSSPTVKGKAMPAEGASETKMSPQSGATDRMR